MQAVCAVLYNKYTGDATVSEEVPDEVAASGTEEVTLTDSEGEGEDDDEWEDTEEEAQDSEEEGRAEVEAILASKEWQVVIAKIRKIYKLFKRSPKSNDKLQRYNKKVTNTIIPQCKITSQEVILK